MRLPVALEPAIAGLILVLEHNDLLALVFGNDPRDDSSASNDGLSKQHLSAISNHQNAVEGNFGVFSGRDAFHVKGLAGNHPILLAAGLNNRVNGTASHTYYR